MKEKGMNIKELIKGIAIVCLYPIFAALSAIPFSYFQYKHIINDQIFYILSYLTFATIIIIINKKDLLKDIKNYNKKMFFTSLKYWLIGITIMIITSTIFQLIGIPSNNNQDSNISILKNMPIFEILTACLFAPIIEEHIFRKSFNKFTNNIHIYAITTGLIFALNHVVSSLSNPITILYMIPFGAVGIAFGYSYKKNDNLIGNIILHSLHNTISIIELIILIKIGGIS